MVEFADRRAAEDPDLKMAEKIPTMPREEAYEEAVRMFTVMVKRMKEYGYEEGTEEYGWFLM